MVSKAHSSDDTSNSSQDYSNVNDFENAEKKATEKAYSECEMVLKNHLNTNTKNPNLSSTRRPSMFGGARARKSLIESFESVQDKVHQALRPRVSYQPVRDSEGTLLLNRTTTNDHAGCQRL